MDSIFLQNSFKDARRELYVSLSTNSESLENDQGIITHNQALREEIRNIKERKAVYSVICKLERVYLCSLSRLLRNHAAVC